MYDWECCLDRLFVEMESEIQVSLLFLHENFPTGLGSFRLFRLFRCVCGFGGVFWW